MDQDNTKENKTVAQSLQTNQLTRQLLNSIAGKNSLEVADNLRNYQEAGIVKYDNLLSIPVKDRLTGLVKQYGERKIHNVINAMITDFCNSFNVIRQMSAEQITQCAYDIIITAEEDQLSIEDVALFFQGAKQSKYGKVFDRLDQQTIFEMFEVYRQARHAMYLQIREEKEAQLKGMGDTTRSADNLNPMDSYLSRATDSLTGSLGDLKAKFSEWKNDK